eukprot:CAMPEP_0174960154 /NCGR_PEP_ID=MMETSP0004_2-20121128/3557_1 /TAXON_ID=420556 /ORGANISM="Ochromonas sp., Strain CCMP1393" /LENGTH=72 /DNA_ID=CAMNT_0016208517 /DNA_START=868 /DNA_END=1085 /DNA_ORIENTATION=-
MSRASIGGVIESDAERGSMLGGESLGIFRSGEQQKVVNIMSDASFQGQLKVMQNAEASLELRHLRIFDASRE